MLPVEQLDRDTARGGLPQAPAGCFATKPLEDPRWERFLVRHPRSSAYHTSAWLRALERTYGYEPLAFTTSPPGMELEDAVVFCDVKTWLTKRRLVSLPFSDHCDVLVDHPEKLNTILAELKTRLFGTHLAYIEFRPATGLDTTVIGPHSAHQFCGHQLDLRPDLDVLLKNCHRDSTQRKIRRAEREGLLYQEGRSSDLLDSFYNLLILTRRRHGVPPQPRRWFQALIDGFGNDLTIRVAFKNDRPIASILTLSHKDVLLYKYGCSDERIHNLGGMHLLFWKAIVEAKQKGMRTFDFGRSDWSNPGLITFKDRWGAGRTSLSYFRLSASAQPSEFTLANPGWKQRAAGFCFSHLPGGILRIAGEMIYPHLG